MKIFSILLLLACPLLAGNPTINSESSESYGHNWIGTLQWDQQALADDGWISNGINLQADYIVDSQVRSSDYVRIYPESQDIAYFGVQKYEYTELYYYVKLYTYGKEYLYHPATGAVVSINLDYGSFLLHKDLGATLNLDIVAWNSTYEFSIPKNLTVGQLQNPQNYPELAQWAWLINWLWGN